MVELTSEPTADRCVSAVQGDILHDTLSTNQADNGKGSLFDGTTERVVWNGSMTSTVPGQWRRASEALVELKAS